MGLCAQRERWETLAREEAGPPPRGPRRRRVPAGHRRVPWPGARHQGPPLRRGPYSAGRSRKPVSSGPLLQAAQGEAAPPLPRPRRALRALRAPGSALSDPDARHGLGHAAAPHAPGAAQRAQQPRRAVSAHPSSSRRLGRRPALRGCGHHAQCGRQRSTVATKEHEETLNPSRRGPGTGTATCRKRARVQWWEPPPCLSG